jgi:hypothetical protein
MDRLAVLLVILLAVAAGCTETPEPRSSAPTPAALPTAVANGGACDPAPLEGLPAQAGCLTGVRGDADGDGVPETFFVYALTATDDLPHKWFIGLRGRQGTEVEVLHAGNAFYYPRVIGAADVDLDGRDELFVKAFDLAGHGTNWQQLELFVVRDGRLLVVTYEGEPFPLRVGGISRMGEGIRCTKGRVELLRTEAQNVHNTRWDYSVRTYEIEGTTVRPIDRRTGKLELSDYNDPALDPYYRLECGELRYPNF